MKSRVKQLKRNDDRLYTFTDFSIKINNFSSENSSPHCGTYTEKGWGILTAGKQPAIEYRGRGREKR